MNDGCVLLPKEKLLWKKEKPTSVPVIHLHLFHHKYILYPRTNPHVFSKICWHDELLHREEQRQIKKKKKSGVLCRIWQNGVVACLCLWTVNHRGDIILPIQPTQDSDAQCNRRDLKDSETEPGLTLCVSFVSECFDNTELQFQKGTEGGRRDKAEELTDSSAEDVPAPTSRYADIVNVIYKPNICWIKIWWVNDWNT